MDSCVLDEQSREGLSPKEGFVKGSSKINVSTPDKLMEITLDPKNFPET